jgi:protein-tyrosine phosphatase
MNPAAVERVVAMVEPSAEIPIAYAVKSASDALDYVPDMSLMARRLARRCWPGPLTLVVNGPHPDSVIHRLPKATRAALEHPAGIALRVPQHPVITEIQRFTAGPVVLARAVRPGDVECTTGEAAVARFREHVSLVLDDGPCRFALPSTVVKISGNRLEVLRPGVLDANELAMMSRVNVLLVCTGNTCRSPMAEGLLRKRLGEKLQCPPDELDRSGFHISSAGIAAMPGGAPSDEAVDVMQAAGVDIGHHRSQMVTDRMVNDADLILTMTASHRQMLVSQWPMAGQRAFTIGRDQGDVFDPIGMPLEYYEACAQQIDHHLQWWLRENPLFNQESKGSSG